MLFTYIALCANNEAVLLRVADLIQVNMQNATGEEDVSGQKLFTHKKGSEFSMKDAKTYVCVGTKAKVNMLLLDLDFFNRFLVSDGENIDDTIKGVSTMEYRTVGGY